MRNIFVNFHQFFISRYIRILFISFVAISLSACAASDASRTTASNIDLGVSNAKALAHNAMHSNISDSYGNAHQTTKGLLIGGTVGGITGAFAPGIGVIPGTIAGALLGGSYGAYIDTHSTHQDQLENSGVMISELGDHILIVIPSANIFVPYTAEIKPTANNQLYAVKRFINSYTTMLVKIAVYSNQGGSPNVEQALTAKQANQLEKFFIASGLNARVLYAEGMGGTGLVSENTDNWGGSDNFRIEITLEKLYV